MMNKIKKKKRKGKKNWLKLKLIISKESKKLKDNNKKSSNH